MRKTLNDHCLVCGAPYGLDPHEPYGGRNRQLSIKYGLVVALCRRCHRAIHDGKMPESEDMAKRYVREYFEKEYPELDFVEIFK